MLSTVLLILLIFGLGALLILVFVHGTKHKNQKLVDEMEKKQQELLVLQVDVQDMLLVMQTYIDESKQGMQSERKKTEELIREFEKMQEAKLAKIAEMTAMGEALQEQEAQAPATKEAPPPKKRAKKPSGKISRIEEHIMAIEENTPQPSEEGKYEQAKQMIAEGKTIDQVAKELHLSKGETSFLERLSAQQ